MKAVLTHIASIAKAVALLTGGAYAMLLYLDSQPAVDAQRISELKANMQFGFISAVFVMSLLDSRREGIQFRNAPQRGGVAVVLLTGLAATIALGWEAKAPSDFLLPGAVFLITLVIAGLLVRFIAAHKAEIGEARFTAVHDKKADDC